MPGETQTQEQRPQKSSRFIQVMKRLGWLGVLFFTIKGLIWLAIFWGAGAWLTR